MSANEIPSIWYKNCIQTSLVILIFSFVSVILSITCLSFKITNVKTKQSVFDHFHLPAETVGKFKAQYNHCCSFSFWFKENKFKLSYTLKRKTYLFIDISCESLKIVKFMDVKKQVLCSQRENLVNNLNILVQDSWVLSVDFK